MALESKIKNKIFPIIVSVLFAVISICLVRNEVFFDDWYIESAADGLFGTENRGILVLGANYLITGIIYLLSLSGIRLSWIHIIMFVINIVSTYMVSYVICNSLCGKLKYGFSLLIMLATVPFVGFYIQFTTTATYCIAAACVWIFFMKVSAGDKRQIIFGIIWVVLGSSLRFDAIYFSLALIGILGCIQLLRIVCTNRKTKSKKEIVFLCWSFISPFIIAIGISCVVEASQRIMMNINYPGFAEWNTTRAHVDDYEIPDYYENEDTYLQLGVSYNDYRLLKSWNNIDENFFTEELYKEIVQIKEINYLNQNNNVGIMTLLLYPVAIIASNFSFLIVVILAGYIVWLGNIYAKLGTIMLGSMTYLLLAYFCATKRMIWRTEWPIFLVLELAIVIILTCFFEKQCNGFKRRVAYIAFGIISLGMILVSPYRIQRNEWSVYNGRTLFEVYKDRIVCEDNYGRYLLSKIQGKHEPTYATIDRELMSYTQQNNDILFYHLFMTSWLQPNPLTNKDLFRTEKMGAAENWATLGQYICRLKTETEVEKNYGVYDRFKDLANSNVRVSVQNWELRYRTEELTNYLKQHYYPNVDFSVTDTLTNVAIGAFIKNFEPENVSALKCNISIDVDYNSGYDRMIKLNITNLPTEITQNDNTNIYIKFQNGEKENHTFVVMKDENNQFSSVIFDDALNLGEQYNISIIVEENGSSISYQSSTDFGY